MITFTSQGHILLMKGDEVLSQHLQEREAVEAASKCGPGVYRLKYPDVEVTVEIPQPPVEEPEEPQEPEEPEEPTEEPSEELPGDLVIPFTVDDELGGPGRPVKVSVVLAEGALPKGQQLVVLDPEGNVLPTQWDAVTSWRTDKSVLWGVATFQTRNGNNSGRYHLVPGAAVSGLVVSREAIVATGFDATLTAVIDGVTYRGSASEWLLRSPRKDYEFRKGPLGSSYCLGGPLVADGQEHSTVQVHYEVVGYVDGRAYVTVTLENTGLDNVLSSVIASSLDVTIGGQSLPGFPLADFEIYPDVRYTARGWFGGDPKISAFLDPEYVQSTRILNTYRYEEGVNAKLLDKMNVEPAGWNKKVLTNVNNSGGAKPDLAPVDMWTAAWLMSGDKRALKAVRTVHDEYEQIPESSKNALSRPRDEKTGHPVDLAVDGRISGEFGMTGPDAFPARRGDRVPHNAQNVSHTPSRGFAPAILFGEFNDIESLLFAADRVWINARPGGYPGTIPNRQFGPGYGARNVAWGYREILNAGALCPDNHPLRATMDAGVTNALNELNARLRPYDLTDQVGLDFVGHNVGYDAPSLPEAWEGTGSCGIPPWMDDWLTWSIGRSAFLGWRTELEELGLYRWKVQGVLGRFGPDYPWQHAAIYALAAFDTFDFSKRGGAPGEAGTPYGSWAEIAQKNFGDVAPAPPGSRMGLHRTKNGKLVDRDADARSYGAWIAPALADAVDLGIQGAAEAWALYESRDRAHWSKGGEPTYGHAPEYAIRPRRTIERPTVELPNSEPAQQQPDPVFEEDPELPEAEPEQPSTGLTVREALAQLLDSMEDGEVRDFPEGAMPLHMSMPPFPTASDPSLPSCAGYTVPGGKCYDRRAVNGGQGTPFQWMVRHLLETDRAVLIGKRNNHTETFLFECDLNARANPWTQTVDLDTGMPYHFMGDPDAGVLPDSGHPYDGYCLDTVNRCVWFHRKGHNGELARWNGQRWDMIPVTPNLASLDLGGGHTGAALEFQAALFGPGRPGIVYFGAGFICAIEVTNPDALVAQRISGSTRLEPYSGPHQVAVRCRKTGTVYGGGGDKSNFLYSVQPVSLEVARLPEVPIGIRGANSNAAGVWSLGRGLLAMGDSVYTTWAAGDAAWREPVEIPTDLRSIIASLKHASQWTGASVHGDDIGAQGDGIWTLGHPGISRVWKFPRAA